MNEDLVDVDATRRVANRALVSAALSVVGALGAALGPFPSVVTMPLLVIALVIGVSAMRTLNHPEARVIGGIRHVGIVLAVLGATIAGLGLAVGVLGIVRG